MKRRRVCIGLALLALLVIAGCKGGLEAGLAGTWLYSTSTVVISETEFKVTDTSWGTVNCSIDNHDNNANHLDMTVTSSSGLYASMGYVTGVKVYVLYSLNGNSLGLAMQVGTYPTSITTTFTRQ